MFTMSISNLGSGMGMCRLIVGGGSEMSLALIDGLKALAGSRAPILSWGGSGQLNLVWLMRP